MNETLTKIQKLHTTAKTLRDLPGQYQKKIEDSRCDKHRLEFNGDARFTVFKTHIFLTYYLGYYGNSGCSTPISIDNDIATSALIEVLNNNRDSLLQQMADVIGKKAEQLARQAQSEVDKMQKMINELTGTPVE